MTADQVLKTLLSGADGPLADLRRSTILGMASPEYLVCLDCETPCYTFEWSRDKLIEILCEVCGNEDVDRFLTQEDLDALEGDDR